MWGGESEADSKDGDDVGQDGKGEDGTMGKMVEDDDVGNNKGSEE